MRVLNAVLRLLYMAIKTSEKRMARPMAETQTKTPFNKTLTATPFENTPPGMTEPLLVPGWVLQGNFSMWDVADFVRTEQKAWPEHRLMAILNNSDHALEDSRNFLGGTGLNDLDPNSMTSPAVTLSTPSQFSILLERFRIYVAEKDPADWHDAMMWDQGIVGTPTLLGGTPVRPECEGWSWISDTRGYVVRVPVTEPQDAIAAIPNGYHPGFLQPHQIYHLTVLLKDHFNLNLFGLGFHYAGYMRETRLSGAEAMKLGEIISPLYRGMRPTDPLFDPDEPHELRPVEDLAAKIASVVKGQHTVFLAMFNG